MSAYSDFMITAWIKELDLDQQLKTKQKKYGWIILFSAKEKTGANDQNFSWVYIQWTTDNFCYVGEIRVKGQSRLVYNAELILHKDKRNLSILESKEYSFGDLLC